MRTIFVLFDSLNRNALGAYGGTGIATPNFDRFAERAMTFDHHYVGSLPCMPARRDMHTGRLNFTHRPWGPLEPFDNSFASLLSDAGVYTHIVTDHQHYFENGGWGYANAFDSWDFVRGQENDPIRAVARPPLRKLAETFDPRHYPLGGLNEGATVTRHNVSPDVWKRSRHAINTMFLENEADYPTPKCFAGAFEFLEQNKGSDDWFLQLECFDPHEPFCAPQRFRDMYPTSYDGKILDWPQYEKVSNSPEEIAEIRANYAALVTMCDEYFGRLLDWMDANDAWSDTALVLTTDHGFLLGEHEWWAKNKMPYYEEIAHIPLIAWHPDLGARAGTRCEGLSQTTDLMPTLLNMHGLEPPREVTAHSLMPAIRGAVTERDSAILGMFAGPLCVTDGRYTYYRFPAEDAESDVSMYTLMPSHLESLFSTEELKTAELSQPFNFTKGVPVLRVTMSPSVGESGLACVANWQKGSCLFDLETDPKQETRIEDPAVVARLTKEIVRHLDAHDAPGDAYRRYGLEKARNTAQVA